MRFVVLSFLCLVFVGSSVLAEDLPTRGTLPYGKKADIFTATPEQIDEALQVSTQCKDSDYSRTYFDCDCLGMKFLQLRQERGEGITENFLRMEAEKSCPNSADVAGMTYRECLTWSQPTRPTYYKDFCSCLASEYALMYETHTSDSINAREAQLTSAYVQCDKGRLLQERLDKENVITRIKKEGLYNLLFPAGK